MGVERQRKEIVERATRADLKIDKWDVENNTSAYSGRARPVFEALLSDVVAGRVSHLFAWDQDRLARDVGEWEKLLRACQDTGTRVVLVTAGEIDLGTVSGRLSSRIGAVVARHESEHKAERVAAAAKERAARGQTHGRLAYGWRRVKTYDALGNPVPEAWHDEVDEKQKEIICELIERVLAGESLGGVCRDLNARGVPSPTGITWSSASTRGILLRPMNAGLREYKGKIIGKSMAPKLVEREKWERLVALLNDPKRRTVNDNRVRYLLTGLALCGKCGGTLRHKKAGRRFPLPVLLCHTGCVSRQMDAVDLLVTVEILKRLARPDARELFEVDDSPAIEAAREAAEIRARVRKFTILLADGGMDDEEYKAATKHLRPRLEAAERAARVTSSRASDVLADLAGPDAAQRWEELPITRRRSVVAELVTVRVLPIGRGFKGQAFDPSKVEITWKRGGDE